MHVPVTLATLILLTAALILLRLRWHHLHANAKRLLILFAVFSIITTVFILTTKISTISFLFNAFLYWCFVLSYIFLVLLFTLLRPKLLSAVIAVVLILPLLSASAFLPLTMLFANPPRVVQTLGDNLVSERTPIDALTPTASGADLTVYYRPTWAPFLQKNKLGSRYLNSQCDANASYAVLRPDHASVLMVCPASPGLSPEKGRQFIIKLNHR